MTTQQLAACTTYLQSSETDFRDSRMWSYFETVLTEPTPRPRRPAARPSARCWPRFSLSCHL
jgi:hypothetical protein